MRKIGILPAIVLLVSMCSNLYAQIPTITSFTPASGQIGSSVTINGSNFSTTPSDNIVWFGAVQAPVISATSTQIDVSVPVGATYKSISVTTNSYTAYSLSPFMVTFPTTGVIDATAFALKIDFTPGTNPYYIAINDIDGDGRPDLAVTNTSSNTVSIFRNTSTTGTIDAGSFSTKVDFATGTSPIGIALGDIDGDGKPDLVVTNSGSNTVSIFRNTSTSGAIDATSFANKVDFPTGSSPYFVAINDIDIDGKPDLAVVNYGSNSVSIFRNTSIYGTIDLGSFAAKVDFTTGSTPYYIAVGDIDGDSKPDLVVTNYLGSSISVFRNTAITGSITLGSFSLKADFSAGSNPTVAAIGDIDGDGKPEIAVSNAGSNSVSVYRNTSTSGVINSGTLASKIDFTTGSSPYAVAIEDIDGDSKPDLAVVNSVSNTVSVFRNTSSTGSITTGSFAGKVDFSTGLKPYSLAVGDLDRDGKPDLAVTNYNSHTLSVLKNSVIVPPVIDSFTPASGKIGISITITGKNFNTTTTNNIVRFGAVKANVTAATKTQLTVTVPVGATFAPITVTDITTGLTAFSREPFKVTFHCIPLITSASFAAKVDFTAGTSAEGVAVGDLDGDSKSDLVIANGGGTVSVLRNTATSGTITSGSLAAKVDFTPAADSRDVAISDIDGDGKLDMAVTNDGNNSVSIFRNTSTTGSITSGSFSLKVDFTTGTRPHGIVLGDVDLDGKPDMIVVNYSSNSVSVFRNTSTSGTITTGSFAAKVDFTTGSGPEYVAIGDIDGDGRPDLAVTNVNGNSVSVFRNTSTPGSIKTGSFSTKTDFATGTGPWHLALGDLDEDGKPDLAVANNSGNTISILKNTSIVGSISTTSFDTKIDFATGSGPGYVALGDLDGDGKQDIAVSNGAANTISVLRNTGTTGSIVASSFAPKVDFPSGSVPQVVVIGDIDGDGKPDLSVANFSGSSVSVLRNTIAPAPPTITSFYPTYGQIGASVNLYGPNFNTTLANNIVWFGAAKATVTYCSETQLTVTIPTGATYQPISVTDLTTGLTGYTNTPFIVGFPSTKVIDATSYSPKVDFPVVGGPTYSALGDLDGDGKPDLVVTNSSSSSVSVFRNISASGSIAPGSFDTRVDLTTGGSPYSVVLNDLDCDGKLDIVTSNFGDGTISVLRNISTSGSITISSFEAKIDFVGDDPFYVAISDIDGDGKPDIVFSNNYFNTLSILQNKSIPGTINASSFASSVNFNTGTHPSEIAISDIDMDGKPDIATVNQGSNTISVFRNISVPGTIGSGSLSAKVDIMTNSYSEGIAIVDIDGDGKQDLINTNTSSGNVSIFRNISTPGSINSGSFATRVNFPTGTSPYGVTIGDLNGDGKADLAVANYGSNTVSLFKNTSTSGSITSGSFAAKVDFATGSHPYNVAIGDIDGDQKPDLAVTNYSGNSVSVFRNSMIPAVPLTITSFSPVKGPVGTIVTITGTNFNTTSSKNIVWFGAVKANVNSATGTQLSVTVPTGATYHSISVTDMTTGLSAFSTTPFTPTYISSYSINASSFAPIVDFPTTSTLNTVSIGDIDCDDKPDLVGASYQGTSSSVLRNISTTGSIGTGSFEPSVDVPGIGYGAALGDIDGDGKLDIALADMYTGKIHIFINNSTSGSIDVNSFAPAIDIPAIASLRYIAINDIDGDGRSDLVVSGPGVMILHNLSIPGSVKFETGITIASGSTPRGIAFGDIDGDGKQDLVIGNQGGSSISVFRNTSTIGSISFSSTINFATGSSARGVVIGDFDGDNKQDIAVANYGSNTISVFRNTSSFGTIDAGSLAPMIEFVTGATPWGIGIGDIDGDGKLDLATANNTSSNISILKNTCINGTIDAASFASKVDLATPGGSLDVAVGDLDGDGKPDLSVGVTGNGFFVFRNIIPIPPVINSFTPTSGPIGTSITITGKNFSAITTDNIVWFGAVKATVTTATETQLTVTVPTGATFQPFTVTINGVTAYSPAPFDVTFPSSHIIEASTFAPKVDFTTGTNPYNVATGDIDGDGKPDMVVANTSSNTLSVYRNISTTGSIASSSFDVKVDFVTERSPQSVIFSDIDGDGKPDLVVTNEMDNLVSVFRNISTPGSLTSGSLDTRVNFATGTNPRDIDIRDIDGDGKPDIAVINIGSSTISVLRNLSYPGSITSGSFAPKVDFSTAAGTNLRGIAIRDIDGDGKPDLAVANSGSNTVSVFKNTSTIGTITTSSFATSIEFATGINPYHIAIGDIDGDGKPDLAVANAVSSTISVLRNTSSSGSITTGSLAPKVDFTTGSGPLFIAFGDLDGDSKPDMAVSNYNSNTVSVFRNTSSSGSIVAGSFMVKVDLTTGTNPSNVAICDIDGDGKPELSIANSAGNTISVLQNTIQNVTAPTLGTITQPTCTVSTGSVVLNGLPATGTWTLTRTPGGTTTPGTGTSTTISGLSTGTYSFTITNSAGVISVASQDAIINAQPGTPSAPIIGAITHPSCSVPTGSVELSGLPATGTWTLTVTPGGTTTNGTGTSSTISGLASGTYSYTVTNAAGCTSVASSNVVINPQSATPSAPTIGTITQPTCATATGSVVLNDLPATGTWTLTCTPGGTTTNGTGTTSTISGLAAGPYTYKVTNASGCVSVASAEITINSQPPTLTAPTVGTITQTTCASETGSVILIDLPGTDTWTLTITPGGTTSTGTGTSSTISELAAGTYTFTVSNASSCMSSASANIVIDPQPAAPTAPTVGTITQPTCTSATGSVILDGLPATGTWTLTRTPGGTITTGTGTSSTVSGLASGTFTYTVTNTQGCISTASSNIVINSPPAGPAAPTVGAITQPTCPVPTGSVALSGLPGTGTWTLTRTPGGTTNTGTGTSSTISGLSSGTYTYTVTNPSGCVSASSNNVVISVLKAGVIPKIKTKWTDILICSNIGDSIASYQWYKGTSTISNATSQFCATNKQPGIYKVETTDKNGCKNFSNTINISGTKSLSVFPNPASVSFSLRINDDSEGTALVTIFNSTGIKVMEFQVENIKDELLKTIPVNNLDEGIYIVEVLINNKDLYYSKVVITK
jgi:hypothetical protein